MNKNCPQCGTRVNNDLPGGLCPTCLMAVARQSQDEIDRTRAAARSFETPEASEMSRLFPELDIIQLVGSGGMGAVYKARQKNLDRIVAIKVFIDRTNDPEFAARFQREARALAKLNHQNIVTVHDFGIRGNIHFLVMEYVDGVNLRQLSQEETLSPEMALQMVPQLCDALQYAHDNGVIHRDIKPENLLLDTRGNVTIADFGLAKLTGNDFNGTLTRTQQVMGTFNYMAPEQRERPTEVDHRADIYSLGVVIYEMLTGELPIGRFQPPSSKSKVSAELDDAVMRALDRDPERRFQQVSEFKTGVGTAAGYFAPTQSPAVARPPVPPVKQSLNPNDAPRGTRAMFTLMAGREKKGNWMPGAPQLAFTMMGGTELDLTNVQADSVEITAFTLMGGIDIIVPHGATVDLDGFMLMGATVDNVAMSPNASSNMRVRVRSWGAMGGCEVRTPNQAEDRAAAAVQQRFNQNPQHGQHEPASIIGNALMAVYTFFAMLVSLAIPVIFVAGNFNVYLSRRESHLYGILIAITAGLIWAWSGYFRILFGAGPKDQSAQAITEYYSTSKPGSMIKIFAMAILFACPMMFVLANYDQKVFGWTGGEDELQFVGICCAIVGGALFATASKVDETIFSWRNQGQKK